MTQQQVAKTEPKALAAIPQDWGNEETFSAKEILIPKLLLMQGLSEFVAEEKAQMGDLVNSVTGQVLSPKGKPLEMIFVKKLPSTWVVFETLGGKREYKETIQVTAQNENLKREEEVNGVTVRRDYCMNFFMLIATDLGNLPYSVTFRRTSLNAGKVLNEYLRRCKEDGIAPARKVLSLGGKKVSNDEGTFYVYEFGTGEKRNTTDQEYAKAYQWFQTFKTTDVKVDEAELKEDAAPKAAASKSGVKY